MPLLHSGSWLQQALTLVPIQICRCDGNTLHAMSDGRPLALDLDVSDVNEVASRINFGMYDVLFQSYGSLPVFVVSSMGSQSVGKSYQVLLRGNCLISTLRFACVWGWLS